MMTASATAEIVPRPDCGQLSLEPIERVVQNDVIRSGNRFAVEDAIK
jgi:hypothetical protein